MPLPIDLERGRSRSLSREHSRASSPAPRKRMGSQTRFTVIGDGGVVADSHASLADLELELEVASAISAKRVGLEGSKKGNGIGFYDVDWMPVYVGECSLEGNNLFDDTLVVAITDTILYVAEPKKHSGSNLIKKIRLIEIVDVEQRNINLGFDYVSV
ncbi:hypothetical protein BC829DRAFT_258987 [Chytridium lagenaria]|nr:hypothetical protein BC829DRAFT_258987 [Chytridium lagenaria]